MIPEVISNLFADVRRMWKKFRVKNLICEISDWATCETKSLLHDAGWTITVAVSMEEICAGFLWNVSCILRTSNSTYQRACSLKICSYSASGKLVEVFHAALTAWIMWLQLSPRKCITSNDLSFGCRINLTFIHNAILFIHNFSNAYYNQAHWPTGTPYVLVVMLLLKEII